MLTLYNLLVGFISAEAVTAPKPDPIYIDEVIETKVSDINYIPNVYNDHIGLTNVHVKPEKLIMRSSFDGSSMLRWDVPNKTEDWTFEVDFNRPNLNSSESAQLYIFYTKEKHFVGQFKGGKTTFHGFAAGMELKGKAVELGYTVNNGLDFFNMENKVVTLDSLDPSRVTLLNNIKLKVICTKNNFKIEIYQDNKLAYDNFKLYSPEDLEHRKEGYFISVFATYRNVASSKAFEITGAQLYKRQELENYIKHESKMPKLAKKILYKKDILHHDSDIQNLIYQIHEVIEKNKSMLGNLPNTTLNSMETELNKEIDMLNNKIKKLKEAQKKEIAPKTITSDSNEIDNKVKRLYKGITDLEFGLENISEKGQQRDRFKTWAAILGAISLIILISEEIKQYLLGNKAINK